MFLMNTDTPKKYILSSAVFYKLRALLRYIYLSALLKVKFIFIYLCILIQMSKYIITNL